MQRVCRTGEVFKIRSAGDKILEGTPMTGCCVYVDSDNFVHRIDGPAIKWREGNEYFYIHGTQYTEKDYYAIPEESREELSELMDLF